MIITVNNKKQLHQFIYFISDLYKDHEIFSPPIFSSLKKELNREVLIKNRYTALLCVRDDKVLGRLMYTISYSKQKKTKIAYFSFFDCVEDFSVVKELFDFMEHSLKDKVSYIEGTFTPYDPDTRRGILAEGFDQPHTILTSYNFPYYGQFLEQLNYSKAYDTFTLHIPFSQKSLELAHAIGQRTLQNYDIRVDDLNKKNLQQDIVDVHAILVQATTELNYQDAPSLEMITKVVNNLKPFLQPKLIKIVRDNKTNRPLGFCFVLPDYNQIFKKTNGKIKLSAFIFGKKKITGARGILQYLIPEYQGSGFWALVFGKVCQSLKELGIDYFEGGTILEDNKKSVGSLMKMGAEVSKIYRIFGKDI